MACQGMEAHQEEEKPASLDTKPEAAQQEEVLVEDAEVILVGEPKKKRHRDRKLAVEHRRQETKTSPRENCGPQERLAVTHTGRTHCATVPRKSPIDQKMRRRKAVARHMRDIFRPYTTRRASVAQRRGNARKKENTQGDFRCQNKELAVDNCLHRLYKQPYEKSQPLRGARMSVEKPAVGTAAPRSCTSKWWEDQEERRRRQVQTTLQVLLRRHKELLEKDVIKNWTLWRGQPPPKQKKKKKKIDPYGRNRW
jgi:hypothetical protein